MADRTIEDFRDACYGRSHYDTDDPQTLVALHYANQLGRAILVSNGRNDYNYRERDTIALYGSITRVLEVGDKICILHRKLTEDQATARIPRTHTSSYHSTDRLLATPTRLHSLSERRIIRSYGLTPRDQSVGHPVCGVLRLYSGWDKGLQKFHLRNQFEKDTEEFHGEILASSKESCHGSTTRG
jgi:hypothetical protein